MTLNQVISRIQSICLAHNQIRNFYYGLTQDFLTDKTTLYPSAFLQDNGGTISITGKLTRLNYRLFLVDLVHVSEDTKANELEVHSDMVSIAMDLVAQFNNGNFADWKVSGDNNLTFVVENDGDMHAGVVLDFSISTMFKQNVCEVPTDLTDYTPTDTDMKLIYDEEYVTTGSEGNTITIPALAGKKVVLVIRENSPLHKVSNAPISSEYTWNDTSLGLGNNVGPGERFLILYRTY